MSDACGTREARETEYRLRWRNMVALCAVNVAIAGLTCFGCKGGSAPQMSRSEQEALQRVDNQQLQRATMSFADRYITAMADVYDRVAADARTPEAAIMAQRSKILVAIGATTNAVDSNPVIGLMDMALMVTLTRAVAEDPWAAELFGSDAAMIVAELKTQEADVWSLAGTFLTPEQITELHQLAVRWHREHPGQRYVSSARLADFPEAKRPDLPANQLVNSVFGLIRLDPFAGLDPAVRQVEESRLLAERMFFYLQHTPVLVSWQVQSLYSQMLVAPQVKQLLVDTATVAGSTTRFADATSRFSDVSGQFAQTVENFRTQLPQQQNTLVEQMDGLIGRQREAALMEATTQVSSERDATIKQLGSTIQSQQNLMAQNLQSVMDSSIDRLYARLRALILITAASILGMLLLFRLFSARKGNSRNP